MQSNRYLVIVIFIFILLIIGELGVLVYKNTKQDKTTRESLQSKNTEPVVSNANTPYDFNRYKTGNWYIYTNNLGMKKLMISLYIRGTIKESNKLYIVPVSLINVPFNLILGTTESKISVADRSTEDIVFKSTLISEIAKSSIIKQGVYVRVSIPLSEIKNKSEVFNDSRCTQICKNNLTLIEKQISSNSAFADMLPMSDLLKSKSISQVGPVNELIIIN